MSESSSADEREPIDLRDAPDHERISAPAMVGGSSRSKPRWLTPKLLLVLGDTAGVMVALAAATLLWGNWSGWSNPDWRDHSLLAAATLPVWPIVFAQHRMYGARFVTRLFDEFRRLAHGLAVGVFVLIIAGYLVNVEVSRGWALSVLVSTAVVVGLERLTARRIFEARRARGISSRPVMIVGTNVEALDLYYMLRDSAGLGYQVVGFVDDDPSAPADIDGVPVLKGIDRTPMLAQACGARGVILAATAMDLGSSSRIIRELTGAGIHVELTSTLRDIASHRLTVRPLGRFPVVYLEPVQRYGWRRLAKRAFDASLSALGLLLVSPVLLAVGIAIKATSHGPVFFRQDRVGRDGEIFKVLKLRTMVVDAEDQLIDLRTQNEVDGPLFKMKDDPRVTPLGAKLRKLSLDEIPQLWNVLRGEMSLVGPRPALPSETELWPEELRNRLTVKPGITGMWQVNGRSGNSFAEYERLDLYYVDNWSILTDLAILLKTIPAVLNSRGAY